MIKNLQHLLSKNMKGSTLPKKSGSLTCRPKTSALINVASSKKRREKRSLKSPHCFWHPMRKETEMNRQWASVAYCRGKHTSDIISKY